MNRSQANILEHVIPFAFLPRSRRDELGKHLKRRRYADGEWIFDNGDDDDELLLLAAGEVELVGVGAELAGMSRATPGQYFGEHSALFEQPRRYAARALGDVELFALAGDTFLQLIGDEPVVAQGLAIALRDKHGIFARYRHLYARILALLDQRAFLLSDLISAYTGLQPALHPLIESDRIDVGALGYAVARLPEGVTHTSFYYLCSELPALYRDPESVFDPVTTRARRRASWRPLEGKLIALLRDGITDVTDLLTCLCLYAVEARKIRHRLRSPQTLAELKRLTDGGTPPARDWMTHLALDEREREGLYALWGDDCPRHLRNILLHHEDIGIECDLVAQDYKASAAEQWVVQVRDAASEVVDLDDPELVVHIISSNTHSVANCLSPYLGRRAEEIMGWGRKAHPQLCDPERWTEPRDLLYVLARENENKTEGERARRIEEERNGGHVRLSHSAFTGIAVDVIDAARLEPALCDHAVKVQRATRPTLIVNVDYAFGQQAEDVLANLLFLFGARVRSINVLGKAGGLVGARGDILLPTSTLLQTNDELYPIRHRDLSATMLAELAPGRAVHQGPVLTVAGTLLQDRTLLLFYRRIFKCVGLEMEGSFFLRQLQGAVQTGIARDDIRTRFAYYVSDLPLSPHDNLSASLDPFEGVPPLYAVTRAVLRGILDDPDGP